MAHLDNVSYSYNMVLGTDSDIALAIMDRFRGEDSAPFVNGLPSSYRNLLEPLPGHIRKLSVQGARTILMELRAQRGLPVHEGADDLRPRGIPR